MGIGVAVVTNGTLLTPALIQRFPEDVTFELTLFSTKEHVHNRLAGRAVFSDVLHGIGQLERHRRNFVIAFVSTGQNALDSGKTLELAAALGAQGFLYNRVNLSRRAMPHIQELVPTRAILSESLGNVNDTAQRLGIQVAASIPIPPCVLEPDQYPAIHFGWCPRGGENAYYTIGTNGRLRPCNHSAVDLGDPMSEPFMSLTTGETATGFWSAFPEECANCRHPMKEQCGGGCLAAAHECLGSAHRVDPFVTATLGGN
jgi:radical SAM protein with 4Fe4S-binding SPASM domain